MGFNKPEQELEEYLARQSTWVRKFLQGDFALTRSERADMLQSNWPEVYGKAQDEYLELLKKFPEKLREYRKLQKRLGTESALWGVPSLPPGAPRKDLLAQEALELQQRGMSQTSIASILNERHPNLTDRKGNPRPITSEVVRKMLASRKHESPPEKT